MKILVYKDKNKEPKTAIGKAWNWLWYSDSIWSWLAALSLAFIAVKFIFFPFLSFLFGTSLPLVVVESSSMEHPESLAGGIIGGATGGAVVTSADFEAWWNEKGSWYEQNKIEKQDTKNWPLKTGFDKGDIMIVYGRAQPKIGDVIIFNANTQHPIIHRIVRKYTDNGVLYFQTKGDHNIDSISVPLDEKRISGDRIVGRAVVRVPLLGWVKIGFVELLKLFGVGA